MPALPFSIPNPLSGINTTIKLVGGAVAVGGLIYVGIKVKKYINEQQEKAQLVKDQNTTIKPPPGKKVFYDLNGKPITSANLSTIASDLKDALNFPVDQGRAVRVFKTTPFGSVVALEKFYLDKYGENLKEKFIDKLSDANWIGIKYNFR